MNLLKRLCVITLTALFLLLPIACNANIDSNEKKSNGTVTVKLGVVGENNEYWSIVEKSIKKKGINLKIVKFSDYMLPNEALSNGEIDMNAFQDYAFLEEQIEKNDYQLTPICNTVIAPLGIYSNTVKDLKSFKENSKIAISNDTIKKGRSLKLLESAGLITINAEKGFTPEVLDIIVNPLHLEFVEIDTPVSILNEVSAVVIDGSDATLAELVPNRDSIYLEQAVDGTDNPYINILVVRTADKDNSTYKIIAETVKTPKMKKEIEILYRGVLSPAF